MSKMILYSTDMSPPCRAVLLAAEAYGIDLDVRETNLLTGEHMTENFKKVNPQHTVPTLVDNGFALWDSHAIMCYFANKTGKQEFLYPKDPQARALVDQRLHFEGGVLFATLRNICKPIFLSGETSVPPEKMQLLKDAYEFMEHFLEGKEWLAGNNYTLADLSCVSSLSSLTVILDTDKYPNLKAWLKRCEQKLPGYAKWNAPGNTMFHKVISSKLQ